MNDRPRRQSKYYYKLDNLPVSIWYNGVGCTKGLLYGVKSLKFCKSKKQACLLAMSYWYSYSWWFEEGRKLRGVLLHWEAGTSKQEDTSLKRKKIVDPFLSVFLWILCGVRIHLNLTNRRTPNELMDDICRMKEVHHYHWKCFSFWKLLTSYVM